MNRWAMFSLGTLAVAGSAAAICFRAYRNAMAEAEEAYAGLAGKPPPPPTERFDPAMIADLPNVAQCYFHHAIAPGTRSIRPRSSKWRAPSCSATKTGIRLLPCRRGKCFGRLTNLCGCPGCARAQCQLPVPMPWSMVRRGHDSGCSAWFRSRRTTHRLILSARRNFAQWSRAPCLCRRVCFRRTTSTGSSSMSTGLVSRSDASLRRSFLR